METANYKHISCFLSLNSLMRLFASGLLLVILGFPLSVYAQDPAIVLVASKESNIKQVSMLDIRRIFLGIPPKESTDINKPVLNLSDKTLYNDFIKNIMHMTEDGYRRKIVKRVFRRGNDYILEFTSIEDLIRHLNNNKNDISFIRKNEIKDIYNLQIIGILW